MLYPGSKLGPYLIDRELGRGGMALVYHAVDERSGGEVALKVLAPGHAHDRAAVRRFQQEGEIALRLRHPNIVRAYEAGLLEGYHYIALDYAAKGTLASLIEQRPGPAALEETVQLLRRVALALDYAHSRDLLHRDVKPNNILLGANGQVWLADFGIARRLDGAQTTMLTASGQTIGTPAYMSPEQVRHDGEIDGRADIYSLGVVAYQMLSGGLPFEAKTQVSLLHKIAYESPIPAQTHNARLAVGTGFVLERVLSKNPLARYPTAATFIDALLDSPHHRPSKAEWEQLRRESALLPDSDSGGNKPTTHQPTSERRLAPVPRLTEARRASLGGGLWVAAALVLLVGIAGLLIWRNGAEGEAPVATPVAANSAANELTAAMTETPTTAATSSPEVVLIASALPPATAVLPAPPDLTPAETLFPTPTTVATTVISATFAEPTNADGPQIAQSPTATDTVNTPTRTPVTDKVLPTATLVSATRAPTSTPIPEVVTDTPTPTTTPSLTPTRAATATRPLATPQPITGGSADNAPRISVQLLAPAADETVDGSRTFRWQATGVLPTGYAFEPVFWRPDQTAMISGLGWGGSTVQEQLSIDLIKVSEVQSGLYRWGVLLVKTTPYERIGLISAERAINVQRPAGSSSGGGGGSPPTPTPRG